MIGSDHRPATFVATSVLGLSLLLASASAATATVHTGLFTTPAHAAPTATPEPGVAVTIVEDGAGATYVTHAKTVSDFFAERNIAPNAADTIDPPLDTKLTEGMRIDYRAAVPVALVVGSARHDLMSSAQTVGQLLANQSVSLGPHDRVQPDLDQPFAAGATVHVSRESTWTTRSSERIAAGVVNRYDPGLRPGTTKTIAGSPGLMEWTTRFVQRDNEALAQQVVNIRVVRQPRARLILHGIGEYAAFAMIAQRGFTATLRFAGDALRMVATAYTAACGGCSGITASGRPAGHGIVAVDPRIIPLGSRLFIPGYGRAIAGDTGGAIRGNRIDLGFNSLRDALLFGRRAITVYISR